ncbi:MAG: hypothetical protein QG608_1348 [Actinomycetota bacterium]|nr:hypothetical protein [Actinomycetota bacterium]
MSTDHWQTRGQDRGRPTGQLPGQLFRALVRDAVGRVGACLRLGHTSHKVLLGLLETARQEVPGTGGLPSCELVALVTALSDAERTRIVSDVLGEPGPARVLSAMDPAERHLLRSRLVELPGRLARASRSVPGQTAPGGPRPPGAAADPREAPSLETTGRAPSGQHLGRPGFPPAVLAALILFWAVEGCCAGWLTGTAWGAPQGILAGLVVFGLFTAWTLGWSYPVGGGRTLSVLVLAAVVVVFVVNAGVSALENSVGVDAIP